MKFLFVIGSFSFILSAQIGIHGLTSSYLKHIYTAYQDQLDQLHQEIQYNFGPIQISNSFIDITVPTNKRLILDWCYAQIRELCPKQILLLGNLNDTLTGLALDAINHHTKHCRGQLTVLDFVFPNSYFTQSYKCEFLTESAQNFEICQCKYPEIALKHIIIRSSILISSADTSKAIQLLRRTSFDQIIVNDISNMKAHGTHFIKKILFSLISKQVQSRRLSLPATQVLYFAHGNKSSAHSENLDSEVSEWIELSAHHFSLYQEKISADILPFVPYYVNQSNSDVKSKASLIQVSLTAQPLIVLLTPCSRPENLIRSLQSINMNLIREWVIVYSPSNSTGKATKSLLNLHPRITELQNKNISPYHTYGNAERNIGLEYLYQRYPSDDLWVYFLDDDNLMHRNIWALALQTPQPKILHMQQKRPDGRIRVSKKCLIYHLDTGSFLTSLQLLRQSRIKWEGSRHDADGYFFQALCAAHPRAITHAAYPAAYWNGQLMNSSMIEDDVVNTSAFPPGKRKTLAVIDEKFPESNRGNTANDTGESSVRTAGRIESIPTYLCLLLLIAMLLPISILLVGR